MTVPNGTNMSESKDDVSAGVVIEKEAILCGSRNKAWVRSL